MSKSHILLEELLLGALQAGFLCLGLHLLARLLS